MNEVGITAEGQVYAHSILDTLSDEEVLDQFGADTDEEIEKISLQDAEKVYAEANKRYPNDTDAYYLFRKGYEEVTQARYTRIIENSWSNVMH